MTSWSTPPGSTLAQSDAEIVFTAEGPTTGASAPIVTWITPPGSLLAGRKGDISFSVAAVPAAPPPPTGPVVLTPGEHLAQTPWTELYSVRWDIVNDGYYFTIAAGHTYTQRYWTRDGKLYTFNIPARAAAYQNLNASSGGITDSPGGTIWQPGSYAGDFGWLDAAEQFGWDSSKPLAIVARVTPIEWPGSLQAVGVGTFGLNGTSVDTDSFIGALWSGNGSGSVADWGTIAQNGAGTRVTTMAGASTKVYGPQLTYTTADNATSPRQWCIGVVRESNTKGYALLGPQETGVSVTGSAVASLPPPITSFTALERVTVPGTSAPLAVGFVAGLQTLRTDPGSGGTAVYYCAFGNYRVYQGG